MTQNPEIIGEPFTIWIAPVGTAFPAVDEAPGEDWALLGKHGARSATSEGVMFVHDRQWASSTPAAETGESIAFIERESLKVQLSLFDLTLEQFKIVLGQNAIVNTAAGLFNPGTASIGLALKIGAAAEFAVLMRGPSPYDETMVAQYELPRCCETGSPRVRYTKVKASELAVELRVLIDPAATSHETRFGRLVVATEVVTVGDDGTFELGGVLYGPKVGPKGPKQVIFAPWNQAPTGYCYSTNNLAEDLVAWWASIGCNAWKPGGHPDGALGGSAAACLAAVEAEGLMMIASPVWLDEFSFRPDVPSLDFRTLAMTDPYYRVMWITYQGIDELDLQPFPLTVHTGHAAVMELAGKRKPIVTTFTRRVAVPSSSIGSGTINFYEAFNAPEFADKNFDSYEWHLRASDTNTAIDPGLKSSGDMFLSTWNGDGIYNVANPATKGSFGRRFTASQTGLAVSMARNGPIIPGRSDTGNLPVQYPPIAFNIPAFTTYGNPILPQAMAYAAGDKATGHYVATGRVDLSLAYARGGQWQPARFLRNEFCSGFMNGSSAVYIFPQTVSQFTVTGYVDATANTLVITAAPPRFVAGALRIIQTGFTQIGWIRRDSPQLSGTLGGAGTYALDTGKVTPVAAGSAGSPVTLTLSAASASFGDDSNAENIAELTTQIANIKRLEAHPTGGNLMIDTVQGGRRAFTEMRCPDANDDLSLYREDMTVAPVQPGYTIGGVPIADSGGGLPLWEFGSPMGFEGRHVVGDDGATYTIVRSMSCGDRPTFFPGFAARGLPARVFGPFEEVWFRRVGVGTAVELTGANGPMKAGVDDGPATWFYIDSSAITQNEGNSGSTAYAITVRRGGDISGSNTVTATVSGTGANPANATDFVGGAFPSSVLSFAAGETTKTFTVNVQGDTTAEQNETFKITLSAPSGGAALVASGKSELVCTITNDDAALVGAFVWLGGSLSGAPALSGAPSGSGVTYLNNTETTFVTRGGVKMRARSVAAGFTSNSGAFSLPYWGMNNASANGLEFELAAGTWEIAVLVVTDGTSGGELKVIDDPAGANTTRYSYTFPSSTLRINDTDGTAFSNLTDAVNNLTYVSVTVSDLGSGVGLLRITGGTPYTLVSAIALRQP